MSEALRVMSREQLRDVRRWNMPTVERPLSVDSTARPTVAELEAIGEQARHEGYEQGLAEGRRAAHGELQRKLQHLCGLCDALARPLEDVDTAVERQLAELAMLVARRVLQAELRLQPEHLLKVVRKAIAALPATAAGIDIHVHPQSAALLREGLTESEERGWRIVEDAELAPGDCRIACADSRVDASIETRLTALVDAALDDDVAASSRAVPDDAS
ncbi:MAG TPA: FliH/SctL family protein [Rhodanobacteraceae bacterium]|nr:FliH/SctL family protein [Oleiagrimonas sp.]HET9819524.1 FliH/SctL family protein [Rhodanobacteraceae bacterium]